MKIYNCLLNNIFDRRILNKYNRILPSGFNIYCHIKESTEESIFYIYIAKTIQNLNHKLDTSKIVGYVRGVVNFEEDEDQLEFIQDTISDLLDDMYYGNDIGKALRGELITLDDTSSLILEKLKIRLITKELIITWISVNSEYLGKGIGQFLIILACNFANKQYDIEKLAFLDVSLQAVTPNPWRRPAPFSIDKWLP